MSDHDSSVLQELGKARRKSRASQKEEALIRQNWECSICREEIKDVGQGHWDHNHRTGAFRAVLCHCCNTGLGLFRDNPDLLRKAALYVELHS